MSRIVKQTPIVVEIVGLAGAGKTTLWHKMCQKNKDVFVRGERLRYEKARNIPFVFGNALLLLPTLAYQTRSVKWFAREDMKKMIYLEGWDRVLERRHGSNGNVAIFLDQGPIYNLATLHGFGPDKLKSQQFEEWWKGVFKRWARALDLIVWLDTPGEILMRRIQARAQWHPVKEKPAQEVRDFLSRYQSAYAYVMSRLKMEKDIPTLHFDSSLQPPERIVSQVVTAIDAGLVSG